MKSMLLAGFAVAAVLLADKALCEELPADILELQRSTTVLGASPGSLTTYANGRANYIILTSALESGAEPLSSSEPRIAAAIKEWESKTCIRFTRCYERSWKNCPRPLMIFGATVKTCSSAVGVPTAFGIDYNLIKLAKRCGVGSTVHEIGHALGLDHEQKRRDRDNFVEIDFSAVTDGLAHNFDKSEPPARDIGPYNHNSIMHYKTHSFAKGFKPTIKSQFPVGQRNGLSEGDAKSIDFLYNGCRADFPNGPTCIASVKQGTTILVPHSKQWSVDFNVESLPNDRVTVAYSGTTAAASYSPATGASVSGYANMKFTPTAAMAGKTYLLKATFKSQLTQKENSCFVSVKVADSTRVCLGVSAASRNVCGGHGSCVGSGVCQCHAGYAGADCTKPATCPRDLILDFDEGSPINAPGSSLDSSMLATQYGASLKLNRVSSEVQLDTMWKPRKVEMHLSGTYGSTVAFGLKARGGASCISVASQNGAWYVGGKHAGSYRDNRFYRFSFSLSASGVTASMNGAYIGTFPACNGFNIMDLQGSGWLDEFAMYC